MRVLFGVRNDGPDAYYRATAPASVLRYQGFEVEARVPILGQDVGEFDILILQRHVTPIAELLLDEFRACGKPIIYDTDDWLFGLPPSWPCYGDFFNRGSGTPKPALEFHERLLRRADMVTCPTKALAKQLRDYNHTVRVVPNCVAMGDWDTVLPIEKDVNGPVIGWFGTFNHWDDWQVMAGVLDEALADTSAWLAIVGFPEVVHLLPERLAKRTMLQPAERFRDFHRVRRLIAAFDVGLAWLADTPFNRCKSPLKAIQYSAAGVPVVASSVVYGDLQWDDSDGGDDEAVTTLPLGYLADTLEALATTIQHILEHLEDAKQRARRCQQAVWERHSWETQYGRWIEVIEELTGEGSFTHGQG